jgi:hypothetical protein
VQYDPLSQSERGCSWDRGSGTPRLWPAGNGHDASSPAPGQAGMTLALWCVEDLRRAPLGRAALAGKTMVSSTWGARGL